MADLGVNEKYDGDRRLDHPNFIDVLKTTFAVGVIKDFQVIQDDPIQVASKVRVRIDGEETGYLPIFYHPKEGFWDDLDFEARDFNETEEFFEKAWMSFQSGDEVVVMVREGVPYAVVGFADGYARVGENVFKTTWNKWNGGGHLCHTKVQGGPDDPLRSGYWLIADAPSNDFCEYSSIDVSEPTGPDEKKMGVVTEAELICDGAWEEIVFPDGELGGGSQAHYKYNEYLIRVGGKLYILEILCMWQHFNVSWGGGMWHEEFTTYYPMIFSILGAPDSEAAVLAARTNGAIHASISPYLISQGDYSQDPDYYDLVAHPGFTVQKTAIDGYNWYLNSYHEEMFPNTWLEDDVINPSSVKVYVRPHTKEQLEAAGMWPK